MNGGEARRGFARRERMRLAPPGLKARREKMTEPLRRGVFVVPATITSLGLLAGFYSLISSMNAHFELAATMIVVAFVCDGLDGRVARLSRSTSQFGVEYDSLSDVVAFGVAPAGLVYSWAIHSLGSLGIVISGLFVVGAALRLARFNVQTAVTDKRRFTGLPVPGAAALIAGAVLAYSYFEIDSPRTLCVVMAPTTLGLAALMISRVPYPSFKTMTPHRRAQVELMAVVLVVAAMLFAMPQFTFFALAFAYVASGLVLMARGERIAKPPADAPGAAAESAQAATVAGATIGEHEPAGEP